MHFAAVLSGSNQPRIWINPSRASTRLTVASAVNALIRRSCGAAARPRHSQQPAAPQLHPHPRSSAASVVIPRTRIKPECALVARRNRESGVAVEMSARFLKARGLRSRAQPMRRECHRWRLPCEATAAAKQQMPPGTASEARRSALACQRNASLDAPSVDPR